MKYALLLFIIFSSLRLFAQFNTGNAPQHNFFDPERDPIALRSDTTLQLLVSEYILCKSVKARMGQDCQVLKTYQKKLQNGTERLIFEGIYTSKSRQHFTVSIPLKPDEQGRFYYISGQAIVCSAPGCNNCTIDQGNCVGCCSSTSNAVSLTSPLLKVQTNIEE